MGKVTLQEMVNRVARTRRPMVLPLRNVDTRGKIDVPSDLEVEGDHRDMRVWPTGGRKP